MNKLLLPHWLELHDNQYYGMLVENLPQKIFIKDRDSVYVSCNSQFAHDLGILPDDIRGKTDYDFFTKELAEKYRDDDRRIIESETEDNFEEKYQIGIETFWIHTIKTPLRNKQNEVIGVLGIFHDVSAMKNVELELEGRALELESKNKEPI